MVGVVDEEPEGIGTLAVDPAAEATGTGAEATGAAEADGVEPAAAAAPLAKVPGDAAAEEADAGAVAVAEETGAAAEEPPLGEPVAAATAAQVPESDVMME